MKTSRKCSANWRQGYSRARSDVLAVGYLCKLEQSKCCKMFSCGLVGRVENLIRVDELVVGVKTDFASVNKDKESEMAEGGVTATRKTHWGKLVPAVETCLSPRGLVAV